MQSARRARVPKHETSAEVVLRDRRRSSKNAVQVTLKQVTLIMQYKLQVTLIIDQTIDTIVTSSSPLAVSKAISTAVTLIITTKLLLIQSDLVSLSLTVALPKAYQ